MSHKLKQKMKRCFFTGLLVLLPAVVSIKVFVWLLTYVDDLLQPFLLDILGKYFFGIGVVLVLLLIMVVGVFAQNYFGKRFVRLVEFVFNRLPFIRTIYSVVRQLIEPFSSENGNSFRQVVMIEYPMKDRFTIGFIANDAVGNNDSDRLVSVFIPSNHLHLGYLVIMPLREVVYLDLSIEEALKIVVSCGIVIPKTLDIQNGKLIRDGAVREYAHTIAHPSLEEQ